MKEFSVTYEKGDLFIEYPLTVGHKVCSLGIQTARDGRVWICIDGQAFIRFRSSGKVQEYPKKHKKGKEDLT